MGNPLATADAAMDNYDSFNMAVADAVETALDAALTVLAHL